MLDPCGKSERKFLVAILGQDASATVAVDVVLLLLFLGLWFLNQTRDY